MLKSLMESEISEVQEAVSLYLHKTLMNYFDNIFIDNEDRNAVSPYRRVSSLQNSGIALLTFLAFIEDFRVKFEEIQLESTSQSYLEFPQNTATIQSHGIL